MKLLKHLFGIEPLGKKASIERPATQAKSINLTPSQLNGNGREYKELISFRDKRSLMEVSLPNLSETFQTIILDINFEDKYLTIDDLFPTPAPGLLKIGSQIELCHRRAGSVTKFKAQVLAKSNSSGVPYYAISMPLAIAKGQRRSAQRISIPKDSGIKVTCESPKRTEWFATVKNLSTEGIKMDIAGNLTDELYRNIVLGKCEIELPTDSRIKCQLEVKNFHYDRTPYKHTSIGARIVNISPVMKEEINRFLSTISRNSSFVSYP